MTLTIHLETSQTGPGEGIANDGCDVGFGDLRGYSREGRVYGY